MVVSMYEIDGVKLDDPAGRWVLESGTQLPSWGEPRLTNVDLPHRYGVLPIPATVAGVGSVVLRFRVFSWSDGGISRCKGTLADLDANVRALMGMLFVVGRLPVLGFTPAGGSARVAEVRLRGAVEPEFDPGSMTAALTVTFEVPGGVWRDPQPVTLPLANLGQLAGGGAPIQDAVLLLAPSGVEMVVRDVVSGSSLTWRGAGALASDERVLVDVERYSAVRQKSTGWVVLEGAVDVSAQISMSAGGFRLTPDTGGVVSLQVSGGSGYVRARRAY